MSKAAFGMDASGDPRFEGLSPATFVVKDHSLERLADGRWVCVLSRPFRWPGDDPKARRYAPDTSLTEETFKRFPIDEDSELYNGLDRYEMWNDGGADYVSFADDSALGFVNGAMLTVYHNWSRLPLIRLDVYIRSDVRLTSGTIFQLPPDAMHPDLATSTLIVKLEPSDLFAPAKDVNGDDVSNAIEWNANCNGDGY